MEFKDARGKLIKIGSFVRYAGTGTIGRVLELKEDEDIQWARIEKPDLWYSSDVLEIVDKKSIIKLANDNNSNKKIIKDLKDFNNDLGDINVTSGGAEGGG